MIVIIMHLCSHLRADATIKALKPWFVFNSTTHFTFDASSNTLNIAVVWKTFKHWSAKHAAVWASLLHTDLSWAMEKVGYIVQYYHTTTWLNRRGKQSSAKAIFRKVITTLTEKKKVLTCTVLIYSSKWIRIGCEPSMLCCDCVLDGA